MNVSYDVVCVYVYRYREHGPEFLLLKRAPGRYMAETWQPVSGGILSGETAARAAVREMREETGLIPVQLFQVDRIESFYVAATDTAYHCPAFAAEVAGDAEVALNGEHTACDWVHQAEIQGRLLWPAQRQSVGEIVQEIIQGGPARPYLQIPT
jgi:dATP pyrophosphohydrolase